ncbi:hypothetical protein SK128_016287, partial [Halocaridina rubra]
DESTFYTNGKIIKHIACSWAEENPHITFGHERDSPKLNVFCNIFKNYIHGPYFFEGNVTGDVYLHMLKSLLTHEISMPKKRQQQGAPTVGGTTTRGTLVDHKELKRISPRTPASIPNPYHNTSTFIPSPPTPPS